LSDERERHIRERHPDLLPEYSDRIAGTLLAPDAVRRSSRSAGARLFSRWYNDIKDGKHVVVVVLTGQGVGNRHWVVTAYLARRLAEGETEWKKD